MSLQNVQAFYERIAEDREFLAQLQATQTQEEGKKILAEAGYDFTSEELEEYTSQMLESTDPENNMFEELNEEQMAAVVGGLSKISFIPEDWFFIAQPMYGIPVDEIPTLP